VGLFGGAKIRGPFLLKQGQGAFFRSQAAVQKAEKLSFNYLQTHYFFDNSRKVGLFAGFRAFALPFYPFYAPSCPATRRRF
jgi:hypothetical protein